MNFVAHMEKLFALHFNKKFLETRNNIGTTPETFSHISKEIDGLFLKNIPVIIFDS